MNENNFREAFIYIKNAEDIIGVLPAEIKNLKKLFSKKADPRLLIKEIFELKRYLDGAEGSLIVAVKELSK